MLRDILPLIVGFVLTTVLGGLLGAYLQQRSWAHQNEARLREEEQHRAGEVCHAVSVLLDKRLYRMLRLAYAMGGYARGSIQEDALEERFQEYDAVLHEWNDRLNLNLAQVGTYFGQSARDYLDFELYERFKRAGRHLENAYRHTRQEQPKEPDRDELLTELANLNHAVYQLNLFMMTQLRGGLVGRRAPEPVLPPSLAVTQPD